MSRFLPSLGRLEAFEATARLGSVSRAADELNLTQSAVSKLLIDLEARLGAALFVRQSRRLFLTDAGHAYLAEVRLHLSGLASATASIMAREGHRGVLNIATLPTFGANWLIPRLAKFRAQHPGLRIVLNGRPEPFDFAFERFDCAIHFGSPDWPGAISERLCDELTTAVASPVLAARIRSLDDLASVSLLSLSSRPFAWREWLGDAGGSVDITPDMTVDTFSMAIEAARCGLAATVLPLFLVEDDLRAGRLVEVLGRRATSASAYYFVRPGGVHSLPAVQSFGRWLKDEVELSRAATSP